MTVTIVETYGYRYLKCDCADTAIRYRVQSNGVGVYVLQCLTCGRQIRSVKKTDPQVLALTDRPSFDESAVIRWQQRCEAFREKDQQRVQAEAAAAQEQERRQRQAEYARYLQTPAWQERRRLVMERAGGICEGCRKRKAVQVHHLTYEHIFNEFLFELVAVCTVCHRTIHPDKVEPQISAAMLHRRPEL